MSYVKIDYEAEEWVRLCGRAATFLAAAFQGVAEQSPEDLDFGSFSENDGRGGNHCRSCRTRRPLCRRKYPGRGEDHSSGPSEGRESFALNETPNGGEPFGVKHTRKDNVL